MYILACISGSKLHYMSHPNAKIWPHWGCSTMSIGAAVAPAWQCLQVYIQSYMYMRVYACNAQNYATHIHIRN